MTVVAWIRPHSFDVPLLVHVLGAMVLVGATSTAATVSLVSARALDPSRLRRLAFRLYLLGSVPAYLVMRVGAEWLRSKEFPNGTKEPSWVGVGYGTADGGALVLLVALVLAGVATRSNRPGLGRAAGALAAVVLVAWLVAVWAMGAKPS